MSKVKSNIPFIPSIGTSYMNLFNTPYGIVLIVDDSGDGSEGDRKEVLITSGLEGSEAEIGILRESGHFALESCYPPLPPIAIDTHGVFPLPNYPQQGQTLQLIIEPHQQLDQLTQGTYVWLDEVLCLICDEDCLVVIIERHGDITGEHIWLDDIEDVSHCRQIPKVTFSVI